jgi:hypothetical protein
MAKEDEAAPRTTVRALSAVLAAVGAGLTVCAALAWWQGGLRLQLGPFGLVAATPLRPATQALAVLLIRECLGASAGLRDRLRFLGLFAALLACLAGASRPQVVGDGAEYVAMAGNLSRGRPPALNPEELDWAASRLLPPRIEGYHLATPELEGADGRQDFYHFWGYSLLAAPIVRIADGLDLPVLPAFTLLNCLLLLTAAFVLHPRCGPRVTLLVLAGPILWWIDKAHTEVYTVALLVVAEALLATRPGTALLALGLVAFQNTTLGVVLASSALWLFRRNRFREKGPRAGLAAALLLYLTGPAYYLWHLGHPSPLSWTVLHHWPSLAELSAILVDVNLGLAFASPSLALGVGLAVVGLVTVKTRPFEMDTLVLLAGTAGAILVIVTQPVNLNSGGTRSVSRYALWLVPLAVPLLDHFERSARWAKGALLALAAASLLMALGDYDPRRGQRYLAPTPTAEWLWRHWPSATSPLPEVFAERTAHFEGPGVVPTATAGCEKALLVGDDSPGAAWPLWCRPSAVSSSCSAAGVYCYANRTGTGYSFVRAPRQPGFDGLRPVAWYWRGSPDESLLRLLVGLPWDRLRLADPDNTEALFAGRRGLGHVRGRIDEDILLVWVDRPHEGAWVSLRPGPDRQAVLIDPQMARVLQNVPLHPSLPTTLSIPYRSPLLLVVVPVSLVPSGLPPG